MHELTMRRGVDDGVNRFHDSIHVVVLDAVFQSAPRGRFRRVGGFDTATDDIFYTEGRDSFLDFLIGSFGHCQHDDHRSNAKDQAQHGQK